MLNTTSTSSGTSGFSLKIIDQFIAYIKDHVAIFLSDFLLPVAGAIIVLMIIWGGFQYIQGNPEAGKKTLTAAIIGLVIVVISFLIVNEIVNVIGS